MKWDGDKVALYICFVVAILFLLWVIETVITSTR